jgi:hypothetical protein
MTVDSTGVNRTATILERVSKVFAFMKLPSFPSSISSYILKNAVFHIKIRAIGTLRTLLLG